MKKDQYLRRFVLGVSLVTSIGVILTEANGAFDSTRCVTYGITSDRSAETGTSDSWVHAWTYASYDHPGQYLTVDAQSDWWANPSDTPHVSDCATCDYPVMGQEWQYLSSIDTGSLWYSGTIWKGQSTIAIRDANNNYSWVYSSVQTY